MKKSFFVLSFIAFSSFAATTPKECEFRLKQNRDQSFQEISLATISKEGKLEDSYRDFKFGFYYKNELSDKKVTKLCEQDEFRKKLVDVINCTNDLYEPVAPENLSKTQIDNKNYILSHRSFTMSKWGIFSYCLKNKNILDGLQSEIALTKSCLEGIQSRLQFNEVLGVPGDSVFKMERNHDELLSSCQTPLFRKTFISTDMQTAQDCYKQKMGNEKLANTFSYEGIFNKLLSESQANRAKVEKSLSLKDWKNEIEKEHLYDDYVAPALKTYTYCAESFLKGKEVAAYYKNQDFVNCVYAHDEDNAESFCANESLLMATKNQLDRRASRGIASKRNRFSSFFGQWQNPFYGEN